MRAAVLTEVNKPLQILDLEQEGPKAGEVRVQVKAAGVCMSDWHIMNGDWPLPLPMVLGHEAAGIVAELGPGVTNVKKGDHVIFSFRPHCGHCSYCSRGRTVLCIGHNDTPRWRMHDGTARVKLNGEPVNQMARIGTFSEYVVCPAEQVVSVRKDLPWTHAAIIGCSVATGVGAVIRHANVEAGSSVLVVGCGGVGLNVVQGAKLAGAQDHHCLRPARQQAGLRARVRRHAHHQRQDRRRGEARAGADRRPRRRLCLRCHRRREDGGDVRRRHRAGRACRDGGHPVLHRPGRRSRRSAWSTARRSFTGTYYGSIRPAIDFGVLADLDMDKRIDLDSLISRTYKFDEINEGFRLMMTGGVARGVIVF